ncbi:MAG: UDP-2,3-diacylglucosamine diphosphatase [Epsilonproteobacteria bacterium]|nr:UDP-2,3-diacylglucosamine diphosphatase [Campylobacterota bacterium]
MSLKQKHPIQIQDGALFISDAHDNEKRDGFHQFLQQLIQGKRTTSQLFLMGDMFDLLVGEVTYTKSLFSNTITLLNTLSTKIEIYYFEGNHDFNLQPLFPNITVIPLKNQPTLCTIGSQKLLLSHGDLYQGFSYTLYTALIRNSNLLKFLNFIDIRTDNSISKKILTPQLTKEICYKISNFQEIIKQKIKKYDIGITEIDFVCEGHHHQNKVYEFEHLNYINFSSFACDKCYYQITFKEKIKFMKLS